MYDTCHPRSDNMVERFNRKLTSMFSNVKKDNHSNWDEYLPYVMMNTDERLVNVYM